jgi:hypothetical protein
MCAESLSEHLARDFARFLRRLNDVDASLESVRRILIVGADHTRRVVASLENKARRLPDN